MAAKSSLPEYDGRRSPHRISNVWRARYTAALDFLEELRERGTARVDIEYRSYVAERQEAVDSAWNKLVIAGHCTAPLQGAVNVIGGHGKHITQMLGDEALLCELAGVESHSPAAVDWLRTVDLDEADPDAIYQNGLRIVRYLAPSLAARRTGMSQRFFLALQLLETFPQEARDMLIESRAGFSYDRILPLRGMEGDELLAAVRFNFGEPTPEDLEAYASELEQGDPVIGDGGGDEVAETSLKLLLAIMDSQQRIERKVDFLARELGYKDEEHGP
jgi:hypothetical protein